METENIITINTDKKIYLYKSFENNYFEGLLEIRNIISNYVVYKVTSSKEIYLHTSPTLSYIMPKESSIVTFKILKSVTN